MPLKSIEKSEDISLSEIQGDILFGLQKNAEAFFLFDIVDIGKFKSSLRAALDLIIYSDEVAHREQLLKEMTSAQRAATNFVAANILFSHSGLQKLADLSGGDFEDAFRSSVHDRGALLRDDPASRLSQFDVDADGILLITAGDESALATEVGRWREVLGPSVTEHYFEVGRVRPGAEKGHEHFGFLDGVSQPGVAGLTQPAQHEPGTPPGKDDQGLPGQDLIKPGAFIVGLPNQGGDDVKPPLPWMQNGSFMVLRRLEQEVLKFRSFLQAAALANGMSAERLGARLVGRWPSGAPVIVSPNNENSDLGGDIFRNNDFDFRADNHQVKCPFLGHIRKSYPRDDLNETTPFPGEAGEAFAETHRIIRAGIPFGFEVGHDPEHGPNESIGNEASRGLMFVSYQSSIANGFEFIQTQWCNNPDFPIEKMAKAGGGIISPGIDLIIGQTDEGRRFGDLSSEETDDKVSDVPLFVKPTGTGYFFSPSRKALQEVLTA